MCQPLFTVIPYQYLANQVSIAHLFLMQRSLMKNIEVKSRRFQWKFQQSQADLNVRVNGKQRYRVVEKSSSLHWNSQRVKLDSAWSCCYPPSFKDRSTTVEAWLLILWTLQWWGRLSPLHVVVSNHSAKDLNWLFLSGLNQWNFARSIRYKLFPLIFSCFTSFQTYLVS